MNITRIIGYIAFWLVTTKLHAQVVGDFTSRLPLVFLETNGTIPNEPKAMARMRIVYNGPNRENRTTDSPNHYDGFVGIELRGSTSQLLSPKKPYSVETRYADGTERKTALLGMPAESDWAFIAPYSDKTLVRDALTYELARRVMAWAPRTRFVELFLNGQYEGIYTITERIKRDADRVNVAKMATTDNTGDVVTGGYILKLDKTEGAAVDGWLSSYLPLIGSRAQTYFQYHYPKPTDISTAQKAYIRQWITRFEAAMQFGNFRDTMNGYRKYVDVTSFIDFTLMNELAKNVDAYRLSTYLYKDRDSRNSRLFAGPVWDFNIAYGNVTYCTGQYPAGWVMDFNRYCSQDSWLIPFWWTKMWEDVAYRRQFRSRWQQLRRGPLSNAAIFGVFDSLVNVVRPAQVRNFQRWPILNTWVWPNAVCCGTYETHVNAMRTWLTERLRWMDAEMQPFYIGVYHPERYAVTQVFPNPTTGPLTFRYYAAFGTVVRIQLFDIQGRFVATQTTTPEVNDWQEYAWPTSLPTGNYVYRVWFGDRAESTGKVLVFSP